MKKTIMTVLAMATVSMGATAHDGDDDKRDGKDFGGFYLGWDAGRSEAGFPDADTSSSRDYSTFFLGWRKATDSGLVYGIAAGR